MIADSGAAAPRGRHHEACRNDQAVITAAREVFLENPAAKMSDVALRAGVGQASLYRRYRTKDELLSVVCDDGLNAIIEAAEAALEDSGEPWKVFCAFMVRYIDSGGLAQLTLAGKFVPDGSLYAPARRAHQRIQAVIDGPVGGLRIADRPRDRELQRRYLALILDGLRAPARGELPGRGPSFAEIEERW
ncbi:TetR/AcrR family transcriptional regulator [Mycolicibacterium palauense]|uniref:TetR/AcrR family transcriptional regulator n=1 Tax=Mycolicibacterium palauense TaxID=2034511 RepID=UPI00159BB2D9|nr:TetR/AcrR family transcriptional regulator [Mycolicibacterium palauense]